VESWHLSEETDNNHENDVTAVHINRQSSLRPAGYQAVLKNRCTDIRRPYIMTQYASTNVITVQLK
jgi:hypothetical protein